MAHSSLLGGDSTPRQPSGTDVASLGPSDLSDSGSDVLGALDAEMLDSDSDSLGTGERAAVDGRSPVPGADILPDHLEPGEAGDLEEVQQALDLDDDEVAEQAEDVAAQAADHPDLVDTSADVGTLAQDDPDEGMDDEVQDLPASSAPDRPDGWRDDRRGRAG